MIHLSFILSPFGLKAFGIVKDLKCLLTLFDKNIAVLPNIIRLELSKEEPTGNEVVMLPGICAGFHKEGLSHWLFP